jgi:hypothetical protein
VNSWNSLSLFSHVWQQHGKLVNGNLIPVNTENTILIKKSVFLLRRTGKHFPFLSLHSFFSHAQITVSLFSSTIGTQQQLHHFHSSSLTFCRTKQTTNQSKIPTLKITVNQSKQNGQTSPAKSIPYPFSLSPVSHHIKELINPCYPEDYCEPIKAKWPNFPSKKHSLPGFLVPG